MGRLPDRRLLMGAGDHGWALAGPEQAALVLGPPRSGKTRGVVIPNVLGAAGPVVSTSTKPDVMRSTAPVRAAQGRCWLYDPTGQTAAHPGVEPLRWSPVVRAARWDPAVAAARTMVQVARPRSFGDQRHWDDRAQALVAPLLHAAALAGESMRTVATWVNRRQSTPALGILEAAGSGLAVDALVSATASEERELSGIWSTASAVLGAYRTEAALATTDRPNFDCPTFVRSTDTVYICAPGRDQEIVAPLVAELVDEIRADRYALETEADGAAHRAVVLALDEVANIAPLPGLPALVSEGGGQGVMTLACFQDLSQAAARWGEAARGFPTVFGAKLILPGVGDVTTLRAVSALVGDREVTVRSRSRTGWRGAWTTSWSSRRQPRLPADAVRRGRPGSALLIEGRQEPTWVSLVGPELHQERHEHRRRGPDTGRERGPGLER
ncbi:MAG TPA: type IV secretory system conjugative DNA transfer family protein [Acidimicrobiales bacterium]|nr:type IV secretory system conjugative DNA transfer family protein [Acidimicrobiales bacterium]